MAPSTGGRRPRRPIYQTMMEVARKKESSLGYLRMVCIYILTPTDDSVQSQLYKQDEGTEYKEQKLAKDAIVVQRI